jgi:hypothetical protein
MLNFTDTRAAILKLHTDVVTQICPPLQLCVEAVPQSGMFMLIMCAQCCLWKPNVQMKGEQVCYS